jgi:hypothetical protein
LTENQYSIATASEATVPDYLLVHDRRDGACWLWGFEQGRRFVEACEPVVINGWTVENREAYGSGKTFLES